MEGGLFGSGEAEHVESDSERDWRKSLSFRSLEQQTRPGTGQTGRRPGRRGPDREKPGRGRVGAAQAGCGLAVQPRRCPCPRPAPVLPLAATVTKGRERQGVSLGKPQARPPLHWAPPSCVQRGGASGGGTMTYGQSVKVCGRNVEKLLVFLNGAKTT